MLHTHLDNALTMYIWSCGDMSIEEALQGVGFTGTNRLRKHVGKIAKAHLGEGEDLKLLGSYIDRCDTLTDQRNELIPPFGRVEEQNCD
jgi:hypothetical protein